MAHIIVDGRTFEIPDGRNLLDACLSLGFNLPYFCWHPAMGSVGACRQCAIKQFRDENDTRGRLVMACMTPAADGARLSIEDPEAREFRARVIAWLMESHPHDCPVCDEGSECHLQDMTVMTGHVYRRYRGLKRTYVNQDLGPFVNHEMNRCIQCYRCVRFYRDYAGGHDLGAFRLHDTVYFGRAHDGVLESEFAGNLVEVCPTGVFTDKTLKHHYTRKWDLQTAPSVCVLCGIGCNTIPGERYGLLRRIRNRYNGDVNGYFLCDRGRYGYEFVNSDQRVRGPLLRQGRQAALQPASRDEALRHAAALLADGGRVIGIGSPRASLEANFALRTLVGPDRFYLGMAPLEAELVGRMLDILRSGPARSPSLADVGQCDAALVLGEDVSNTAPMLALALRQSVRRAPMAIARRLRIPEWDDAAVREAVQQQRGPLFIATPAATRIDEIATRTVRAAPDDIARLGFAVAREIDPAAPAVPDLTDEERAFAAATATALREAERPLVLSGAGCGSRAVIEAAVAVARALRAAGRPAELCFAMPECNSLGLAMMGGHPLADAVQAVRDGTANTVIVLENDLFRRVGAAAAGALAEGAARVIVIDHLMNETAGRAEVALPAATFAESDGTLVNNEGRAQRFYQVFVPEGDIQESWRWLRDLMTAAGRGAEAPWPNLDAITAALVEALPAFQPVAEIAPPADFRVAGQKIPRQPARYSGRTAMWANISVHEPKPPDDPDSALAFSMEGFDGQPPPALIPRFWTPGWNSIQALNKFQEEVGGPLRGGNPGRRLIEPAQTAAPASETNIPPAFRPRSDQGEWLLVPVYHVFGSEELSVLTPGIADLAPRPYAGLNPADAERLRVADGGTVELATGGVTYRLPLRPMAGLPAGLAAIPAGLPGLEGLVLPAWGRLTPSRERPATGGGDA